VDRVDHWIIAWGKNGLKLPTQVTIAVAGATSSGAKKHAWEVLPDGILNMLHSKQREFILLMNNANSFENNSTHNHPLDANHYKQSYEATKSAMYNDVNKKKADPKKDRPYQPTIQSVPIIPMKRQPPGASARDYFNSLDKKNQPAVVKEGDQEEGPVPVYLAHSEPTLNKIEASLGAAVLVGALLYYFYFHFRGGM
jgi:hypothetical protein